MAAEEVKLSFRLVEQLGVDSGAFRNPYLFQGPGFIGIDVSTKLDDAALRAWGDRIVTERFHRSEIHPDAWQAAFIRDPKDTEARLAAVAGEKYSYRELDDFTALIQRTLQGTPEVSKVDRSGVLAEKIYLDYSQQRLAEYGVQPSGLRQALSSRNITLPGGLLEVGAIERAPCINGAFAPHAFKTAGGSLLRAKLTSLVHLAASWTGEIDFDAQRRRPWFRGQLSFFLIGKNR